MEENSELLSEQESQEPASEQESQEPASELTSEQTYQVQEVDLTPVVNNLQGILHLNLAILVVLIILILGSFVNKLVR